MTSFHPIYKSTFYLLTYLRSGTTCDVTCRLHDRAVTMRLTCVVVLGLLHSATSLHHDDRPTSSGKDVLLPPPRRNEQRRHRRARDDGSCELEIHCDRGGKADGQRTPTSGVVRLPIRGQRGPPGTPGAKGEKGDSGTDGHSGSLFRLSKSQLSLRYPAR